MLPLAKFAPLFLLFLLQVCPIVAAPPGGVVAHGGASQAVDPVGQLNWRKLGMPNVFDFKHTFPSPPGFDDNAKPNAGNQEPGGVVNFVKNLTLKKVLIYYLIYSPKPVLSLGLQPMPEPNKNNASANNAVANVEHNHHHHGESSNALSEVAHHNQHHHAEYASGIIQFPSIDCKPAGHGFMCSAHTAIIVDSEESGPKKHALVMGYDKEHPKYVKIGEYVPDSCELVLPKDIAHNQRKSPHHKAEEGSELPEVNAEVQKCPQKTINLDEAQLDSLYKHQNHHALVEPHEKIVKEYLARMGGSYSVVSAHSGRLLQKVTVPPESITPNTVTEHILWNQENKATPILVRFQFVMVQQEDSPGTWNFCVNYSPYYVPTQIGKMPCIQINATASGAPPPAAPANPLPPNAIAPGSQDTPADKDFSYMAVCSDTSDKLASLCAWVQINTPDKNATAGAKPTGTVCAKGYKNDGVVQEPDELLACQTVDMCVISGRGCPGN